MEKPRGEDVARLHDTRNVVRTSTGLEERPRPGMADVGAKPRMNRTQRRAFLKFMKSPKGKAALARAQAESAAKQRDNEDAAKAISESINKGD